MSESLGIEIAKRFVDKGDKVVDVGAGTYQGGANYVEMFLEAVGEEGKVYAFDAFTMNLPDVSNLIKISKPVWSTSGKFKPEVLFPWGISVAMSTGTAPDQKEEYEAVSLDDYFPTERIDFVKMDIEGAEAQAILGMKNLIDRNPDFKMIPECHWSYFTLFNSSKEAIWDFLKEHNLKVCALSASQ